MPASNGLFVPFLDGTSVQLYDDDLLCEERNQADLAPADVEGLARDGRCDPAVTGRAASAGRSETYG